jgi:hypothetical protein
MRIGILTCHRVTGIVVICTRIDRDRASLVMTVVLPATLFVIARRHDEAIPSFQAFAVTLGSGIASLALAKSAREVHL